MKKPYVGAATFALALYCAPVLAQHGHGVGGGSMSPAGMGHANSNASSSLRSASTAHGQTMDEILSRNTNLSSTISKLTGESAQTACSNFKNLGQCVAAAHVSKNLGITFACLKDDMTGTAPASGSGCPTGTGSSKLSLGKSIQSLSPNSNSNTETKKASQQANQDLKGTPSNS